MIYTKSNPVGIDKVISKLQPKLDEAFNDLHIYGRVEKVKSDDKYVLSEIRGDEYPEDILDGEKSRIFFYLSESVEGDTHVTAKVDIICMVNLDTLYNSNERRDEEFRIKIAQILKRSRFKQKGIKLGMSYIESLVSRFYEKANIKFENMHPYHAVTFQTEVYYELKTC